MDDTIVVQTEQTEMNTQLKNCREELIQSRTMLMEVSNYCDTEYLKNRADPIKSKQCLDQTKQYTTQSLASVAYQINTLATTFLQILEMQTAQLNQLETSINKVSQKVDLYSAWENNYYLVL